MCACLLLRNVKAGSDAETCSKDNAQALISITYYQCVIFQLLHGGYSVKSIKL